MTFHAILQARPAGAESYEVQLAGATYQAMRVDPVGVPPFERSFPQVADEMNRLPRMFLEPDGSFVWTVTREAGARYQLDGTLYDDGARLRHVELLGSCDRELLDQLLRTLGWPTQRVMFQLVQQGIHLSEEEFRRYVEATAG